MLTFKQFILEQEDDEDYNKLIKRVVPAMRHNGKVYIGKRGDDHYDVHFRHASTNPDLAKAKEDEIEHSFHDPKTKKFHNMTHEGPLQGVCTNDLMTRGQRIRKYGYE